MYWVISPTAAVALLVLFLFSISRMVLDIVIRAIAITMVRGCGWWLMGAFWSTLFQVAVAPMQWAMAIRRQMVALQMGGWGCSHWHGEARGAEAQLGEARAANAPRVPLNT
jgi:hypothetical protein